MPACWHLYSLRLWVGLSASQPLCADISARRSVYPYLRAGLSEWVNLPGVCQSAVGESAGKWLSLKSCQLTLCADGCYTPKWRSQLMDHQLVSVGAFLLIFLLSGSKPELSSITKTLSAALSTSLSISLPVTHSTVAHFFATGGLIFKGWFQLNISLSLAQRPHFL